MPDHALRVTGPVAMVIAMSAGAGIRSWIATAWSRPTQARVPMHWVLGIIGLLAASLYTSERLLLVGAEQSPHNTYYVVVHSHYAISLGAIFAFFAGWYYLFPKLTGRLYSEALGRLHFWLTLAGVGLILLPLPLLLALEPPQRFVDYSQELFTRANWWASVGSYLTAGGLIVFAAAMLHAWLAARGRHG